MVCEIINPSDPYTLETDDFVCAAVAICYLGNGQLGLQTLGEEEAMTTPILFGWEEWFEGRIPGGVSGLGDYLTQNAAKIADILGSVYIGTVADRKLIADTLPMLTPEKREEWLALRQDRKRSSMNNIGDSAREIAKMFRRRAGESAPVPDAGGAA